MIWSPPMRRASPTRPAPILCGARPNRRRATCRRARLDLLVSLRTERLDWRYDLCLESVLPEMTVAGKFETTANLFAGPGWSLAVMVHPADLGRQEFLPAAGNAAGGHLLHRLFRTESLEKGVILRGRARVWFLPDAIDAAAMVPSFAAFAAADPPLGT